MRAKTEHIENLIEKISGLVSDNHLKEDIKRNVRALIQSSFSKLDLVTMEEFEAQKAILARTREKVDALEQQLERLTNPE